MKKLVLILALALTTALGAALPGCAVSTPMRTLEGATEGLDTVLVERYASLGGVCLNVGCIPSKALLHTALPHVHLALFCRR